MISIVIPVYRSAGSLTELYDRIRDTMTAINRQFEIIFVEDNSGDGSWEVIARLARQDSRIKGIRLTRNYGQHNALLCGIRSAGGELIVTLDDDLQNPPEEIPALLKRLDEATDVVYGYPANANHSKMRNAASWVTKFVLQRAMGAETAGHVSAFRVFRTTLRDGFSGYRSSFVNIDVLLTWSTTRFADIAVRHDPRRLGRSGYSLRKLVAHAFNMVTGFSVLPLQLASILGFIFSAMGGVVLFYVLLQYIINEGSVRGFPFLASIIAIFSGVQLFAIGIIGEYLSRMHFQAMNRPAYLERERTSDQN